MHESPTMIAPMSNGASVHPTPETPEQWENAVLDRMDRIVRLEDVPEEYALHLACQQLTEEATNGKQ